VILELRKLNGGMINNMIKIKVSNICTVSECPSNILKVAKKTLTIPNPAYEKIKRITDNSWAAKRNFKYFKMVGYDCISFPRGFCNRFIAYLDKQCIPYELVEDFVSEKTNDLFNKDQVKLRDYQEKIIADVVKNNIGVIHSSTGSGKTTMACYLAKKLALKTTILVPNTVIQDQFVSEFKQWFNYDVGIINGKKKEIKDITVSTFQSLSSNPELLQELVDNTGMLIVDECHTAVSNERAKILNRFKAIRMYGMSGTPKRSKDDGKTESIFFYFGKTIATYEATLIKPTIELINSRVNIPVVVNYADMVKSMVNNESRNKLIAGLALGEAMSGHSVLILTKRVEHCKLIKEALPDWGDLIYHATGEDKNRNQILDEMRNSKREFKIIIGTVSLLATGTNIPCLDTLIIAGDLKSDVMVGQAAGRILRLFEGKERALIYDIVDFYNPIFKRQFYERRKLYNSQGWKITNDLVRKMW